MSVNALVFCLSSLAGEFWWLPKLVALVVVAASSSVVVAPCTLCRYSVSRISSPLPPFDQRCRAWVGGLLRRFCRRILCLSFEMLWRRAVAVASDIDFAGGPCALASRHLDHVRCLQETGWGERVCCSAAICRLLLMRCRLLETGEIVVKIVVCLGEVVG